MCVRNVDVHVSCSSHVNAQLAAFFIDPRAKGSTEVVCIFFDLKHYNLRLPARPFLRAAQYRRRYVLCDIFSFRGIITSRRTNDVFTLRTASL